MRFKSDSCFARTGGSLNSYDLESEAAEHAVYIKREHGSSMVPYQCSTCGFWHLSPEDRQTNSSVCSFCTDRNGNKKDLYYTERDAFRRAEINMQEKGVALKIYKCPNQEGWHLTKGSR